MHVKCIFSNNARKGYIRHLKIDVRRQNTKWGDQTQTDRNGSMQSHFEEDKTTVDGSCTQNGWQQDTITSTNVVSRKMEFSVNLEDPESGGMTHQQKTCKVLRWRGWLWRNCRWLVTIITRNKSNASFEAVRYRQDLFIITHYYKRKRFPSYTRCSENHNNTSAENRKIRGLKFDTLYWRHLAAHR